MTLRYFSIDVLRKQFFLLICFFPFALEAQISYGGSPLPLEAGMNARSRITSNALFVDMPEFNANKELWRSTAEKGAFKSLTFAHKFHVHLRPDNSGITFTTSDNMNVWRVGVRSKGAYSLNILFSKFSLPEGAKVFVYNAEQTEILGSYTHQNNSDHGLLPIQPIGGDELIVEYQEPKNSPVKGQIEIGEVNHDYTGIFRSTEPRDPLQSCHPNVLSYPEDVTPGSGVVALIINGTTYCTGVLVNNSLNDGTPYLLTATHCLNDDYNASFLANRRYDIVAGSIVAFFNYKSPVIPKDVRGPVQMTVASADSILINEKHDISLLRLNETPPKEYQPYYLGWNVNSSPSAPFHGIHHPNGGIQKVAIEEDRLSTGTFTHREYNMERNAHWVVRNWETAATEGGSSGSPLLDKNKRIVGTLTGGESMCSSPKGPDLYASLYKAWQVTESLDNPNSLQYYLDPEGSQLSQIDSYNPYSDAPLTRSQNFDINETPVQTVYNGVPLFKTNNSFGYSEFAEEFYAADRTELKGVFIASAAVSDTRGLRLRIRIYTGDNSPENQIYEELYNNSFAYYDADAFQTDTRDMNYNSENYIEFRRPISVTGKFYISYIDLNNSLSGFSVLNVEPRKIGSESSSTAWMKNSTGWVRSSENLEKPINTSFLIAPYVVGNGSVKVDPEKETFSLKVYHDAKVGRIIAETNRDLISWKIFYVSGQLIHQEILENSISRASFSSAHLPKGVYIVKVKTTEGNPPAVKILVR
ncbi:MAG TPA: hypothetical protein DDW85_12365 [Porphyromonadaceae bacterium]|nr:hypothetical protein [Porphyromonadaceae bacterium]